MSKNKPMRINYPCRMNVSKEGGGTEIRWVIGSFHDNVKDARMFLTYDTAPVDISFPKILIAEKVWYLTEDQKKLQKLIEKKEILDRQIEELRSKIKQ